MGAKFLLGTVVPIFMLFNYPDIGRSTLCPVKWNAGNGIVMIATRRRGAENDTANTYLWQQTKTAPSRASSGRGRTVPLKGVLFKTTGANGGQRVSNRDLIERNRREQRRRPSTLDSRRRRMTRCSGDAEHIVHRTCTILTSVIARSPSDL